MSHTVRVVRDVEVALRDGVTLATDVYLPEGDGPFPTLIYRVRGSRSAAFISGLLLVNPLQAVRRGYAVVIQEVRGRGGSSASWHPWVYELDDGEDCFNWVLAQPWCDGRLGAYGTAYSAVGATFLAMLGRPELKAIAVLGTGADFHDGWVYTNGAFELGWNVYWCYMTLSESISRLDVDDAERARLKREYAQALINAPQIAARLPVRDHPLLERCGDLQFHEWLDHADYDEYWQSINVLEYADRITAPVLSIVGWHDNFLKAHFDMYRELRSPHRLIVGPWEHANYVNPFTTSKTGDVEFGPDANCGAAFSEPLVLDWMDRWVKGVDAGPASGVRYWQLGSDEWRDAPSWPPPHTEQRWYFHSAGGANTRQGDGRLGTGAPSPDEISDSYVYDPADPVPTVGGKLLMPTILLAGIEDQRPVEDRADVLCYTSPALTEPVAVAGPLRVELWASSSCVDTDFTAKLVDVAPDGYAALLADGIVRARYRNGVRAAAPPLVPGEPTPFTIDLWDLAHTFRPGHRIRVEIASANFPRFDRNLNTSGYYDGKPNGSESLADARVAAQQVHHRADHASCLVLPVVAS